MSVLIFLIVGYILLSIALFRLFPKAGAVATKGLIPGIQFVEWNRLIGRSPGYTAWLLFPIVNLFIYAGMCVDLARSFGRTGFVDAFLAVTFGPLYFHWLSSSNYQGPVLTQEREYFEKLQEAKEKNDQYQIKKLEARNPYQKGPIREWAEAIIFAVFAAAFIRMFLIEAYVIPTSSMEGSLLTGDFLFVSKVNYGIRTPQTIAMVPLLHNRLPFFDRESYLKEPSLPYFRLPGFEKVDRYDPVVFNYPEGDSVVITPGRTWSYTYWERTGMPQGLVVTPDQLTTRPLDKKDHYIKRCVGLPGDTLRIVDRQVVINGKPVQDPKYIQYRYRITSPSGINLRKLEEIGVNLADGDAEGFFNLDARMVEDIRKMAPDIRVDLIQKQPEGNSLFPNDPAIVGNWTVDNYGPVWIPRKGSTIELTLQNLPFYQRVIGVYEKNSLRVEEGRILINEQPATSYTFKMDYYWMMGDNRHYSEDSRIWGFVPEDHIVGKPLFIWLSAKGGSPFNGIRWNRVFTNANKFED